MVFEIVYNRVNPESGKTYKEENLEKRHAIPIGTLVEVKWDEWFGDGACWKVHARLWVVAHTRDCDGTPLYSLSRWSDPDFAIPDRAHHGFGEQAVMPIRQTVDVESGIDVLAWDDDVVDTDAPPVVE